ncbi:MAG: regulatory protein RecX [Bacteroidales bacterium]
MDEFKKWLTQMQRWCSTKEYCKHDIVKKLNKTNLNQEEKNKIIDELFKHNYLNEARFVKAFIHDKLYLNKWGLEKIKYVLKQKEINPELYQNFFQEIEENKYIQTFLSLAQSKWKSLKDADPYLRKQKLIRYLMGRGVEYEIAEKIQRLLE